MSRALEALLAVSRKSSRTVVGMISGTSADSIDVAVCRIVGEPERVELVHYAEQPLDPEIQSVGAFGRPPGAPRAFRTPCAGRRTIRGGVPGRAGAGGALALDVDLIGSHGQTVYHHSSVPGAIRSSLQVGDGDVIAERTGLPVVCDFRARDIAAGGEGAPVTPRADMVLFAAGDAAGSCRRAVLNLGGIANVTVLDPDPATDTRLRHRARQRPARPPGIPAQRRGARLRPRRPAGAIGEDERLGGGDAPGERPLPREDASEIDRDSRCMETTSWPARRPSTAGLDADLMATLTEFTARTVALAFDRHVRVDPPVRRGRGGGRGSEESGAHGSDHRDCSTPFASASPTSSASRPKPARRWASRCSPTWRCEAGRRPSRPSPGLVGRSSSASGVSRTLA